MQKLYADISKSIKKYRLYVLRDVIIFMIITLAIHFAYRYWANTLHYFPVENTMNQAHEKMAQLVFNQSTWLIDHVLTIPISTGPNRFIYFKNDGFIAINQSCSGLKPILQFVLLMLIFPGPWKHKAWFIPMGIVIVHCTNLFRISGLAVVTVTVPEYWDFAHDNVFRPFFYVVIFLLWVWWAERFKPKASSLKPQA